MEWDAVTADGKADAKLDELSLICALIARGEPSAQAKAILEASKLNSISPNAEALLRKGIAETSLGRFDDAKESLLHGRRLAQEQKDGGEIRVDAFDTALEELQSARLLSAQGVNGSKIPSSAAAGGDKYACFMEWLTATGTSSFAKLCLRQYGPDADSRGVHARVDVQAPKSELLRVGREYLISVEMGKACPVGVKVAAAAKARRITLTAARHCYLCIFLLWDQAVNGEDSFFAPYYAILPSGLPGSPLFWSEEELGYLQGSHVATQTADRKDSIRRDYESILSAAPEFAGMASLAQFMWARAMVASRNFAIVLKQGGPRTDVLVPFADMLNHRRPLQTHWGFNHGLGEGGAFVIRSTVPLQQGQQVYDSYGTKCNSRFLLNYGFTVANNVEAATGENYNELRLLACLRGADEDPWFMPKLRLLGDSPTARPIRVSTFYDSDLTGEAFSWLRFVCAAGYDVARLPSHISRDDFDWVGEGIQPLSEGCEMAVLRRLAYLCSQQLGRYPTTLAQDRAQLVEADGDAAVLLSANKRNALILLIGEKEICEFYVSLPDKVAGLLSLSRTEALHQIATAHGADAAGHDPASLYIRRAINPLVLARSEVPPSSSADHNATEAIIAPTCAHASSSPGTTTGTTTLLGGAMEVDIGSTAFGMRFLQAPPTTTPR